MSTQIISFDITPILIQAGYGAPDHVSSLGTEYTDLYTALKYVNKDGILNWVQMPDITYPFSGGSGTIFSGGTVTGPTIFTTGLSANTISATTYYNLPLDINITGGTYSAGTAIFTNNTGGTFSITGFSTSTGNGTTFTGGTVSGATSFTNRLTANTISATTYYNLPLDIRVTGSSFNNSTYDLTLTRNDGVTITSNLSILASDMTVTGGTYNINTGIVTFTNNSGGTFNVTGFTSGMTDTYTTGGTVTNGTATFTKTNGGTYSVSGFATTFTGGTINGLTANTISATTYYNLPTDIRVTGGTYNGGNLIFINNTGGTFNVTGITTTSGYSANYYGSFSNTGNLPVSGANIATVWTYDTTEISNGIVIENSSRIKVYNTGVYEFGYSPQIEKTQGTDANITIWAAINGVPVTRSSSTMRLVSNSTLSLPYVAFIFSMNANDYLEFYFSSDSQYVQLTALSGLTGPTRPNAPSIIVDVKQVGNAVTNTLVGAYLPLTGGTVSGGTSYISGLTATTFVTNSLGFINVANTFTSFLSNSNTASRTYTFQNRTGTIADLTDIATKMNIPSLTANYIPKALTTTTIGNSRLWDTGTFLGIGTVNAPTKDITLGNNSSKEIGIEDSNSVTEGNDFIVSGGRAINFITTADYTALNQTLRNYRGIAVATNKNVYVVENGGSIYMQTAGTGNFNNLSQTARGWYDVAVHSNGNVYATVYTGDIYMQTAGTGNFVALGQTSRGWTGIAVAPNGNVYATTYDTGDIYMQTAGTGNFVALGQTLRQWRAIVAAPNGNVYATVDSGDIYMQTAGTGNFVALGQTSRLWYGIAADSNGNIYATVNGGSIYKQTAGTGNFVTLSQTSRNWWGIDCATNSNNVYSSVYGGDIYIQTNEVLGTSNLSGGKLKLYSGTGKGSGDSSIEMYTGQVLASGTTMQTATLRAKIDNTGLMTLPSVTNTLISGDTTGKAVVTKEYLTNAFTNTLVGAYLPLTGGTVTGGTIFTSGVTANTLTSINGFYSVSAYTGPYIDGIVTDYVLGNGRISVGSADTLTFYTNGIGGKPLLTLGSGGTALLSASTQNILKVIGSGNSTSLPIFTVQGSQGELFSVSDSLTGSLFSVNDISGLPVLEAFSDNTILMGSYLAPSLNTTVKIVATTGSTNIYSIPTSAYTGAFFDYTINDGTNLRGGNIMSIWSGSTIQYTETSTNDIGNTSGLTFNMIISDSSAILKTSGTTGSWTIKTIVRSI
jgi:hypothetical protein